MTNESIDTIVSWGTSLVAGAKAQGFPIAELKDGAELGDLLGWAKNVSRDMGGFVSLPALADDAGYDQVLAWAKVLDKAVRDFGQQLPPLPA